MKCWQAAQVELGLYESLVSQELESGLAALSNLDVVIRGVDAADQPLVMSRYVQSLVEDALNATKDPSQRLLLVNSLVATLANTDARVSGPARQLLSVTKPAAPGGAAPSARRPSTPLSDAALLTNSKGSQASAQSSEQSWSRRMKWTSCAPS